MRNFHVPFDMHTEDKIIGGYLSLRQLAWFAVAALVILVLFVVDKSYIHGDKVDSARVGLKIIVSIVVTGFSTFMAFGVINELTADKHLFRKIMYSMKPKVIKYTDKRK